MIAPEVAQAEQALVEGGRVGVGGAALPVWRAGAVQRSGHVACNAVRRWNTLGAIAEAFPYAATVSHYQCVGRAAIDRGLITLLRHSHGRVPDEQSVLRAWLSSTFDQDDGDYDTYVGTGVFSSAAREAGPDGSRKATDALVVAAAADLVQLEADALAVTPNRAQDTRTRAAIRVLTRHAEIAPDFVLDVPAPLASAAIVPDPAAPIWRTACRLARSALQAVPIEFRRTVEVNLLPTTRLHDEQMFIRCIQIFEGIYQQVADSLRDACAALVSGDHRHAVAELIRATIRVESTPALFRVLTTMPIDVFAVIRGYTHGRSAIQSRAYRDIEYLAAPREPVQLAGVSTPRLDGPSVTELYLGRGWPSELTGAMARLDAAWTAMKRSHWGLTLKIIGRVPGTGGTAGADYLRQAAELRLFPCLAHEGGGT